MCWDGQRPCINWILRDFRRYLIQKKIKPEKKNVKAVYSANWDKRLLYVLLNPEQSDKQAVTP